MNKTRKKINQQACYNRIWSWSPMPCEKHGPRASVTTKTSAFGLGFCLLSPSGHVFHTARETMIKSYINNQTRHREALWEMCGEISWRHQMETFLALLALCAGNSPTTGEFPTQRPVSFDLYLNKRLSKQSWGWLIETPSRSLWRHWIFVFEVWQHSTVAV